ncbi:MAG TPA: DsbC family protein [Steroidobacteraceae bacterium]|jgi:thiol:disulfide interchange protein DsbC|nr:DsbC family protein [Steroidobacteraceae bacterium]
MRAFVFSALLALAGTATAADQAAAAPDARAAIAKKFPGVKATDVKPSPIPGMYEVSIGADTAYVSADAKYVISGDLYDIDTRTNLTEAGRSVARSKALAKLDERDMIVFAPETTKYTITVFTDVECGYCRKLHSQIAELNQLGVRVRYAAYPRQGPGSSDWHKMEAVWCAKDRKAAITQAKQGQEIKSAPCSDPVEKQYQLGEELGIRGTPAIFTPEGDYIGGYLPPAKLVEQLQAMKAASVGKKGK